MLVRLKFLTAGESHGQGLLGILDGIPSNLEISEEYINIQLARRQMGHGRGGRINCWDLSIGRGDWPGCRGAPQSL